MNRNLFATCILALAFAGAGSAQGAASSAETGAHYTKAQLKQLALNAHAPAQYAALASYYGDAEGGLSSRPPRRKRSGSGGARTSRALQPSTQGL